MDANSFLSKPQSQKQNLHIRKKSLDDLPDEVIKHILSFLPIENAVRTSILSKRWEFLWSSVPKLDFSEVSHAKRKLFMNFVERVLLNRGPFNIDKFSLTCGVLSDASRIIAWISAVVRHNVQEVYITLDQIMEPFVLPRCLFNCASLRALELKIPYVLKLPSSICFASLKILSLRCVMFSDEYSTQQLFSGCPALEELSLDECNFGSLKVVRISAPKLWKLSIKEIDNCYEGSRHFDGCQVIIVGTSLKDASYSGSFTNEYHFCNSSLIEEASIHMCSCWGMTSSQGAYRIFKLLHGLSSVQKLTMTVHTVQVLSNAAKLQSHLPKFDNLKDLVFTEEPVELDNKAMLKFLQNSPSLDSLVMLEGIMLGADDIKDDVMLNLVPPRFLSQLDKIEIYQFDGYEDSLCALKILLQNAKVLNKIVISFYKDDLLSQEENEIREQILELLRGSESCEIIFC